MFERILVKGEKTVQELKHDFYTLVFVQKALKYMPKSVIDRVFSRLEDEMVMSQSKTGKFDFSQFDISNWWEFEDVVAGIFEDYWDNHLHDDKIYRSFLRCHALRSFRKAYAICDFDTCARLNEMVNGNSNLSDQAFLNMIFEETKIEFNKLDHVYCFLAEDFDRFYAAARWIFEGNYRGHNSEFRFFYKKTPRLVIVTADSGVADGDENNGFVMMSDKTVNPD